MISDETKVLNPVIYPLNVGGRVHLNFTVVQ